MTHQQRVEAIFLEALDLTPPERDGFLRFSCRDDADMLLEIESLLAADTDSEALIESAVQEAAASLFTTQDLTGERLGLYRIIREVGRGGMGSVYLAVRDDAEYRKDVAIKIVRRGMDTADVLERFRRERQILARLEHPYIARLFDGGSTRDGVPYFVMEYIEGKPVDVFCREKGLDRKARCELFLRIVEAVAYAHRNLLVHRDLKPANILVTADGTPKLLDFGVAKLLSSDPSLDRTATQVARPLTPAYASPEQVLGTPITTATDIYSLGAILYELLVGEPAQRIGTMTPLEIERVVCQTEIARPSSRRPDLPSDLDNIILMAMCKEPERRYLSAVQFGEDVRRFLDGKPVIARQSSFRYRVTKFILRNRVQVAAIALIAISLVAGLGISLWQTHRANLAKSAAEAQRLIAERQTAVAEAANLAELKQQALADQQRADADRQRMTASEQRERAEHEKAIAEQRAKDMVELSGHTLFDVHDAIANLPGSMAARQSVVNTTLKYLEGLEKEAGLDDQMRMVLCAAYFKVAMIQGDAQGASLQQFDLAEKSLLKGQEILMPAYRRHSSETAFMMRLVETRSSLADLWFRSGRAAQGIQAHIELLPVARRLYVAKDCSLDCWTQEPVLENNLAKELVTSNPAGALEHANRGIALSRDLLKKYPDDANLKLGLGSLMAAAAAANRMLGKLEDSKENYLQSIAIREDMLRSNPTRSSIRRNLMVAYGNYVLLLALGPSLNLHQPSEARIYALKCVALARQAVAADPDDATARRDLGMSLSRMGAIDPAADGVAESLGYLEEAQSLLEPVARENAKSTEAATQLAGILEDKGHRLAALGRNSDALESYRKSIAVLQPFFDRQDAAVLSQYFSGEKSVALLEASTGDRKAALDTAGLVLAQASKLSESPERSESQTVHLARAWSIMAITQSKLKMTEDARASALHAMKLWDSVQKPSLLLSSHESIAETKILAGTGAETKTLAGAGPRR